MEKYVKFVNETKTTKSNAKEIKEGDFIFFKKDSRTIKGLYGKIAEIVKIENSTDKRYVGYGGKNILYHLKFDSPIGINYTITKLNPYGRYENQQMMEETTEFVMSNNFNDGGYGSFNIVNSADFVPAEFLDDVKKGNLTKCIVNPVLDVILKKIKFKITEDYTDATYFDCDRETEDLITYIPSRRIKDLKPADDEFTYYKLKNRQGAKVGRILRKLNPNITDVELENFVHEYKAAWQAKMENIKNRLRVVVGDEIKYWYLHKRYAPGGGSLHGSCMQGEESQPGIAFYADNPNCVGLAILLDDNDKLLARAIVWRLSEPKGEIFMDRIYSVNATHERMLINFAKENGIRTKLGGSMSGRRMEVRVKEWKGQWPYLDTFHWDYNKKVLCA